MIFKKKLSVCIVGLGYVGLPLAVEFAKKVKTVGFDINKKRILQLKKGIDITNELTLRGLKVVKKIKLTNSLRLIKNCNYYIITVPTPVRKKIPDLRFIIKATKSVSQVLKKNDIVIYESTVYPGLTEEVCLPILEKFSKLKLNIDFGLGYSPERINPGDKKHRLAKINKVVSGSSVLVTKKIFLLYKKIIRAKVINAYSIKVAEAAKIIENTQRDVNIALVNEFQMIFDNMNIKSKEVFDVAKTKWNFLDFRPGLVGGHCIGVDPYYLSYKSKKMGYNPKLITAGRKINDQMHKHLNKKIIKILQNEKKINLKKIKLLFLGLTFKENCPDIRNSRIFNMIGDLTKRGISVLAFDPIAAIDSETKKKLEKKHNFKIIVKPKKNFYTMVILMVPHNEFKLIGRKQILTYLKKKQLFLDYKNLFALKNENYFI
jgi:nucleotide sugar dehydrogenase